jgi:hypothetical protein
VLRPAEHVYEAFLDSLASADCSDVSALPTAMLACPPPT